VQRCEVSKSVSPSRADGHRNIELPEIGASPQLTEGDDHPPSARLPDRGAPGSGRGLRRHGSRSGVHPGSDQAGGERAQRLAGSVPAVKARVRELDRCRTLAQSALEARTPRRSAGSSPRRCRPARSDSQRCQRSSPSPRVAETCRMAASRLTSATSCSNRVTSKSTLGSRSTSLSRTRSPRRRRAGKGP
jgi:hypothetical protein